VSAATAGADIDPALPVEVRPAPAVSLSGKYRTDAEYRANAEWQPKWTPVKPGPRAGACDECAQLQHETRGKFGPRMQPRKRRVFPTKSAPDPATGHTIRVKGPVLALCSRHAQAWEELDADDIGPEQGRRAGR
jgi:hypothetical protein